MRRIIASVMLAVGLAFGAAACSSDPAPISEQTVTIISKELTGRCDCYEVVYTKTTNPDGSVTGGKYYFKEEGDFALVDTGKTYVVKIQDDLDYLTNIVEIVREVEG